MEWVELQIPFERRSGVGLPERGRCYTPSCSATTPIREIYNAGLNLSTEGAQHRYEKDLEHFFMHTER